MMDLYALQEKLSAAYGPSGQETAIADLIASIARPYADEITRDTLGNLIVRKKGSGPRVMFAAHMDSLGLMVTHIDEQGYLWFSPIGGVPPHRVYGTTVCFADGLTGVVGAGGKADMKTLTIKDLYIDIGAGDEQAARALVQVGDVAVYRHTAARLQNNCMASSYMDDRIACTVLLAAMEELPETDNDLYFVFTVQEEVGIRGGRTAAYGIDPEYGFAVDVCGVGDTPECTPKMECVLGGGATVKLMDASVICHPRVVAWLEDAAKSAAIPYQREVMRAGGTDAGAIHITRSGVYTGGLSIPTRYVHNPVEVCSLTDVEACVRLVRRACCISLVSK